MKKMIELEMTIHAEEAEVADKRSLAPGARVQDCKKSTCLSFVLDGIHARFFMFRVRVMA